MHRNSIKHNLIYYSILAVIGVTFLILNIQTPIGGDDYAYNFIYGEHSDIIRPTSEPVKTLSDLFYSQWNHYKFVNGRGFSHFMIQAFNSITGKWLFNLLNVICLISFIHICSLLISGRKNILILICSICYVLYLYPDFGLTLLWVTGAPNYFWGPTLSLLLLYSIFKHSKYQYTICQCIVICFASILCAWMNESVSLPISALLLLYCIKCRKEINTQLIAIIGCYIIGSALLVFSPSTFSRAINEVGGTQVEFNILQKIGSRLFGFAVMSLRIKILLIGVFALLPLCFRTVRKKLRKQTKFFALLFIFSVLLTVGINMQQDRVYNFAATTAFLYTMMLLVDTFFTDHRLVKTPRVIVSSLLMIMCVPACVKAIGDTKQYYMSHKALETRIKNAPTECLLVQKSNTADSPYVYAQGLGDNPLGYHNRVMGFYYHKKFLAAVPENVLTTINTPSPISTCTILGKDDIFTICKNANGTIIVFSNRQLDKIDYTLYKPNNNPPTSTFEKIKWSIFGLGDNGVYITSTDWKSTINYHRIHFFLLPSDNYNYADFKVGDRVHHIKLSFGTTKE